MKSALNKFISVLLVLWLAMGWLPSQPVLAAGTNIQVNSNADVQADDGACTLREAIIAANTNTASGASGGECAAGSPSETDTITFAGDYTITLSSGDELLINSAVNIEGNGRGLTIVQADACNPVTTACSQTHRVLRVGSGGNVTLKNMTIRHGRCAGSCTELNTSGGGILNNNFLTLNNVAIEGNRAYNGGGIYNQGMLTVTNSLINNNRSVNRGGGIHAVSTLGYGAVSASGSVFSNNTGGFGGAIYNEADDGMTITNSTFSGNTSETWGGALAYYVDVLITNSVFSGNTAQYSGGAIYHNGDSLAASVISNTVVTGNTVTAPESGDGGGGVYSTGGSELRLYNVTITNNAYAGLYLWDGSGNGPTAIYNTIIGGNSGGDCVFDGINPDEYFTADSYNIDTDGSCKDATQRTLASLKLGALGQYGGGAQTIPLQSGSTAIDAGDPSVCAAAPVNNLDQRGVTRPQDGNGDGNAICDVGAYEAEIFTAKSSGAQDGWILESSETSNQGGTLNKGASTLNVGDDAANRQYRAVLSFNTAPLPDTATVTKVTLRVKRSGTPVGGGNPITAFGGFVVDVRKGNFGASALQLTDFQTKGNKTISGLKPALVSGWYNLNLTGAKAQINKTGNTQICLRFKLDDNNNFIANFLKLHSGNSGAANRPQLIVEYHIP